MAQYKIKIFKQLTDECCKVIPCESNIQQDAKEEYSRVVTEIDLPDGEYRSQLFQYQNGIEKRVPVEEYSLKSENHKTIIS